MTTTIEPQSAAHLNPCAACEKSLVSAQSLEERLGALTAERDAYKSALQDLDSCNWLDFDYFDIDDLAAAKSAARTALATFAA